MRTDQFDFTLPEDRIALRPVAPRDAARMLIVEPRTGHLSQGTCAADGSLEIRDAAISDLPDELRPGDVLVFNDTRVIPAALEGVRWRGEAQARISANLHKRIDANHWRAFVRPARKLNVGERIQFGQTTETMCLAGILDATVTEKLDGGEVTLAFDLSGPDLDITIATVGFMPLPPYIAARRPADADDRKSYQTVYARTDGAVAAPTAGLHFTDALFDALKVCGVSHHFLTLHVGAGTFLPVKADETSAHRMHAEWGEITVSLADALNSARKAGGRVVAVGTTVARLLESAAGPDGQIKPFAGDTDIFMTPGYKFRAIDGLLTNFHLPRSTLFMLVSAFSGLDTMQAAYAHAVRENYRFYSYGDASLLWPQQR